MTKDEIIIELEKGKKVFHDYFAPHEWIQMKNGEIHDEGGSTAAPDWFWDLRNDEQWLTGWDIYNDQ